MKKVIGYRIYKELINDEGKVLNKVPLARTNDKGSAYVHAKVWANGIHSNSVYEVYSDGEERKIKSF